MRSPPRAAAWAAAALLLAAAGGYDLFRRLHPITGPALPGLERERFQPRTSWRGPPLGFELKDVSASAGLIHEHQRLTPHPKLKNLAPWLSGLGAAVAVADVDGDGWQDVFLTNSAVGSTNALFRNNGDGTFTDIAARAGLARLNKETVSLRPLFFDADNDGDKDLLLTTIRCPMFFKNRGDGTFRNATRESGLDHCGVSVASNALDFDGDGDLDLVIGDYFKRSVDLLDPKDFQFMHFSTYGSGNGGRARFYANDGTGRFSKVEGNLGIERPRWNLSIGIYDFRGTGRPDIHFALDYNLDLLYLNQGDGRYVDASEDLTDTESMSAMSSEIADAFNDGRPGIFVTYIDAPPYARERNAFWRIGPDGRFTDEAARRGISRCGWAWGAKFLDLDNDTRQDLVVLNGYISGAPGKDYWQKMWKMGPMGRWMEDSRNWPAIGDASMAGFQQSCVFLNDGDSFKNAVAATGLKDDLLDGRSAAAIDYLNDGSLSLLIANQDGPARLYRNRQLRRHRWIGFELAGTRSGRDAWGTTVTLRLKDGTRMTRQLRPANGFMSQSDPRLHFGLGPEPEIVQASVRWPSGASDRLTGLDLDRYHRLIEPEGRR